MPRGYHVLGIAAYENYNILRCDAGFFSDARRQVFDGVQHTNKYDFATITMVPSDGVAKRTEMALKYLDKMYPTEDWGYFLNQDGTVRWSDVIFTGISHGASNAPRFAMLVRASRSVSFAGPRDNSSGSGPGTDAYCPALVSATWLDEMPLTPIALDAAKASAAAVTSALAQATGNTSTTKLRGMSIIKVIRTTTAKLS